MKILLFSRPQIPHTADALRQLFDAAHAAGLDIALNEEFAEVVRRETGIAIPPEAVYGADAGPQPAGTVLVSYGGDGTLLEAVHRLGDTQIPVLGINAGHLGFLTGAPSDGLEGLFRRIAAGELSVERRTMLDITGDFPPGTGPHRVLNEFTVQRHGAGMISVETFVDGEMVATYHGDGIVISTPTGSTAYSLSAGGPVVAPACACIVLSPLAPHNLTMRPVVIPDTARIELRVHARHAEAFVTLDHRTCPVAAGSAFVIRRSERSVLLASAHNISFYDTLRNKMLWGIDLRS